MFGERDSDWICSKCRKFHRRHVAICRNCGHIPEVRVTRACLKQQEVSKYVYCTLRKYGLLNKQQLTDNGDDSTEDVIGITE